MTARATYRGEVLPNVAELTDAQIADRIRHAAEIDRGICRVLRRHRAKHDSDEAARAAADALQAWIDIGLASIVAAEHRQQVSILARRVNV